VDSAEDTRHVTNHLEDVEARLRIGPSTAPTKQPELLTRRAWKASLSKRSTPSESDHPAIVPKCGLPLAPCPCKELLMAQTEIMTMRELCAYLKCHQTTIYRLIKRKALPHFKIGSDYRFVASEIATWTRQMERRPSTNRPALRRSRSLRKSVQSRP
jgi:excisionase family DNA binding protein